MPGAALYVRVSTDSQDLDGQEHDLREEAARRGLEVAEVYRETVTGTGREPREEYDRLLRDAADPDRRWTHVVVWALDRFSREVRFTKAVDAVLDLEAKGVRIHFLKDPMLDTPEEGTSFAREVLLALLPVVSKFEAVRRAERTRVAMREIKAGRRKTRSGRPPGRPVRVTDEKVEQVIRFREQGLSWAAVAQRAGLPKGTCAYAYSRAKRGLWKPRALETVPADGGEPAG